MSEEKPPKPNGTGTDPLQRLASLKPSRDLSLGGVKPNKKIFTPNLNVARNKNKGPSTSGSQHQKKDDKNRRDRKNDKNKNFNKSGPNVIKSSGVFSEGLGSAERHSSRMSYGRDGDPAPALQKPTIRVKDFVKIDKELEEQKIRSVTGGSGGALNDDDAIMDFKKTTESDAPIKLPMDDGSWSQPKRPVKVKEEVIVKTEPEDMEHISEFGEEKPKLADLKREPCEETEVVNLLRSKDPTLILLQLPDCLPGRGGGREEEGRRARGHKNEEPSTSAEGAEEQPKPDPRCHLRELEEGRIGTLRTHRSGRVTLLLGDTVFEVNMGTKPAFHQEVVSLATDDNSRSASVVSLGPLRHKLSIVPHWETLLKDINI